MFEKGWELISNPKSQITWAQNTLWRLKRIHVSIYHFQPAEKKEHWKILGKQMHTIPTEEKGQELRWAFKK